MFKRILFQSSVPKIQPDLFPDVTQTLGPASRHHLLENRFPVLLLSSVSGRSVVPSPLDQKNTHSYFTSAIMAHSGPAWDMRGTLCERKLSLGFFLSLLHSLDITRTEEGFSVEWATLAPPVSMENWWKFFPLEAGDGDCTPGPTVARAYGRLVKHICEEKER